MGNPHCLGHVSLKCCLQAMWSDHLVALTLQSAFVLCCPTELRLSLDTACPDDDNPSLSASFTQKRETVLLHSSKWYFGHFETFFFMCPVSSFHWDPCYN
ncbi:hypothetical protein ACRRTK_017388 [Alexandromys fortis]